MNLSGKVALITGASGDIGKAIALELSKAGAIVALHYYNNKLEAELLKKAILSSGGIGEIYHGDLRNKIEVQAIITDIISKYGRLDILVNNAGISRSGMFIDSDEELWDEMIATNIKAMLNCSKSALEIMLPKGRGNIINISSIWGITGASCEVIYSMTKGAVITFTKALAKEVAGAGIRINCIAPGVIKSKMNNWLKEEELGELIEDIPLRRIGTGEDVGKVVVFLAAKESQYITGQVVTVDGGMI